MKIGTLPTQPVQIKTIVAKSPVNALTAENRTRSKHIHFSGDSQANNQQEGFWSQLFNLLLAPFRWLASLFGFGGGKAEQDSETATSVVTTEAKGPSANRHLSADQDETAIKAYKTELVQSMIQGLASARPEVRQNARQALRNLGVTEAEMEQLRLSLEKEKMQKASVQFGSHFPFKMSGHKVVLPQNHTVSSEKLGF